MRIHRRNGTVEEILAPITAAAEKKVVIPPNLYLAKFQAAAKSEVKPGYWYVCFELDRYKIHQSDEQPAEFLKPLATFLKGYCIQSVKEKDVQPY